MVHPVLHSRAFKKETQSQPQSGLEAQTRFKILEQQRPASLSSVGKVNAPLSRLAAGSMPALLEQRHLDGIRGASQKAATNTVRRRPKYAGQIQIEVLPVLA
jgi:hypothetical protein